jgi:hypothetical protein
VRPPMAGEAALVTSCEEASSDSFYMRTGGLSRWQRECQVAVHVVAWAKGKGDVWRPTGQWRKAARPSGDWGNATWHRPTGPRASRTGIHGAVHQPWDASLSRCARTTVTAGSRHCAPETSHAGAFRGKFKFGLALFDQHLLQTIELKGPKR